MLGLQSKTAISRAVSARPFAVRRPRSLSVVVRAEEEAKPKNTIQFKPIPSLVWIEDTETIKEVFAFSGPAPERNNGRLAMWGFLWGVLEEHNSHIPVADQFADSWLPVLLTILSISMATILPKLVSGVSLKTLMETATGDNLDGGSGGQILRYFDATNELLIGRVAMMGFSGLLIVEALKADAIF